MSNFIPFDLIEKLFIGIHKQQIKIIIEYCTNAEFYKICFDLVKDYELTRVLFQKYKLIKDYEWIYVDNQTKNDEFNKPHIILYGPITILKSHLISTKRNQEGNNEIQIYINFNNASTLDKLKSIKLFGLNKLEHISNDCLSNNPFLESIDFDGLSVLTSIDNNVCSGNQMLKSFALCNLLSLYYIGHNFICYNKSLQNIELKELPSLYHIGDDFLGDTDLLEHLELKQLPSLEYIGYHFSGNSNLLNIIIDDLPKLKFINKYLLNGSYTLQHIIIGNIPLLTNNNFLLLINTSFNKSTDLVSVDFSRLPIDEQTKMQAIEILLRIAPNIKSYKL
jgi:hypothetical protein